MLQRLVLANQGPFKGDFIIAPHEDNSEGRYSIGDYLQVVMRAPFKNTGETINLPRGVKPLMAAPVTVLFSCHGAELDALIKLIPCRQLAHWVECLEVDRPSIVTSHKHTKGTYTWFMPNIDGWVPSFNGRERAATRTNRKVKK
jgi:hypothetical protein